MANYSWKRRKIKPRLSTYINNQFDDINLSTSLSLLMSK